MNTFLILANNAQQREEHAFALAKNQDIDTFDISFLETVGSIGIEDIRNFQKQIFLKPFKSTQKAAVIKNAHTLTIEAQNALLKTLEEPPANTYIFLTADINHNLLPTILSRTSIVSLSEEKTFDKEALQEIQNQLQQLFSESLGSKLKLAETLAKDKQQALTWLEQAIFVSRNKMIDDVEHASISVVLIENFQQTYRTIKTTNVNTRFALENLFLNLEPVILAALS